MIGPTTTNITEPGTPVWQYDRTLKRGEVRQLVHGRAGMDVMMERLVTGADGRVIRRDRIPTKYRPWEDFFIYGPGITPPPGVTIAPPKK